MDALIVVAAIVGIIGLFTVLSGIVWLIERYVPRAKAWLDRHVGEEPSSEKGW